LRHANNTEERVPVPEALLSKEDVPGGQGATQASGDCRSAEEFRMAEEHAESLRPPTSRAPAAILRDPRGEPNASSDSLDHHAARSDSTEGATDPAPAERIAAAPRSRFHPIRAVRAPERPRPEA